MNKLFEKKLILTSSLLQFIIRVYLSIYNYDKSIIDNTIQLQRKYLEYIQHVSRHEGWRQALKLGKEHRAQYLGLLQGKEICSVPFRKNKNGVLTLSWNFFQLSGHDVHLQRLSVTVLSVTRQFVLKPKRDLSSIMDPFKGCIGSLLKTILLLQKKGTFSQRPQRKPTFDGSVWYSNKSGPNGPSGYCAHIDASVLTKPANHKHWIHLRHLASQLGASEFIQNAMKLSKRVNCEGVLGRLHFLPDKEGKTRNIFIGDYYTQKVFRILHKDMMRILGSIPEDYTFSQNQSEKTILRWMEEGNVINGFDLSNATERFPLTLQKVVIEQIYGTQISESWYRILSDLSFKDKVEGNVKFAVGQPMGYYTSWAAFSLTHHSIIHLAAYISGISPKDSYCLVGDDVVIKGQKLSEAYLQLLKDIGVEVNLFKSTSYDGHNGLVEFLKRLYTPRGEITPFPLNTFLSCYKNISNLISLQEMLHITKWPTGLFNLLLERLPITRKSSILIGCPLIEVPNPALREAGSFWPEGTKEIDTNAPLRIRGYAGGNKGLSWSGWSDELIQWAIFAIIKNENNNLRASQSSFAEGVFGNPEKFFTSLKNKMKNCRRPVDLTISGFPPIGRTEIQCHPVLLALIDGWMSASKEVKFERITFDEWMGGMSKPVFKRITSLSERRFLPEKELEVRSWARVLIKAHILLKDKYPIRAA